jgi:lysophospholipase L1-like esterase
MRVLVFGDSITQGYWAIEHGWVDRVRMYYDGRQIEDLDGRDEPTIFNLGISADNSQNILLRIKNELIVRSRENHKVKPIVLIQIGINDSSEGDARPSGHVDIKEYRTNLSQIVESIAEESFKIIFIGSSSCDESLTTPVGWGEYYYTNENIKRYEDAMKSVAEETGVKFVPVFDEFKKYVDAGEDLLADGLHPNDAGHELIYQIVIPKLQEILK